MPTLEDLLSRGYLPKELPPPFSSRTFGTLISGALAGLPPQFNATNTKARVIYHNLVRGRTLRRTLGIPNPVHYYRLARFVVENWPLLERAAQSPISLTVPKDSPADRAFMTVPLSERPLHAARIRAAKRYVLFADVARFYPTLYTHSISWALHTKAIAKRRSRASLVGDTLDKLVRNGQDGQTLGIPIGPDISLLIGEIVLAAVDRTLTKANPASAFRYIDDYEFGHTDRGGAEDSCGKLQEALQDYELALNPLKTTILELPQPLQKAPFSELRVLRMRENPVAEQTDLLRYFDRAFALSLAEPDEHILNYAMGKLRHHTVDLSNWPCLQDLMIQGAVTAPSCLRFVLDELWRYRDLGYSLDGDKIAEGLNAVIQEHAPLGHGNEVAWAIWGLLVLGAPLEDLSTTSAVRMADSVVALLLLHAFHDGLITKSMTMLTYLPFMKKSELYGEQWLLSYEANVKGWLPSVGVADHVGVDPCFGYLKRNGVSFYDESALVATRLLPPALGGPAPLFPMPIPKRRPAAADHYE